MKRLLTCCKQSKTHTSVWHQIESIHCEYNGRYCRQLIATCNIYCLFWRIFLKFKSFNIASHQKSDELCLHCQHFLMETTPRLHYLDSTLCKWSASYCPILHPFIHPNTCGTNPPPRSKDNMRPRRSGPAQVQVTEILFPHLSFLPMNEALSAEEWDPYLPFGIAHVVTNQKQMSRQVVLCSDSVCVRDWVGGG